MSRPLLAGLAAALVVIIAGLFVLRTPASQEPSPTTPDATQDGAIPGVETFDVASADHVDGTVDYPQDPPAGGPHASIWQDCGFYDAPVRNEHAVHSQEHGAVWITYRPDLPAAQVGDLRRLAEKTRYVLVSPYPDLPAPIVASAWGNQLKLERADDPRLRDFVRAYAGNGPEPGAPCDGGTGETLAGPSATPASPTEAATPAIAARGAPMM